MKRIFFEIFFVQGILYEVRKKMDILTLSLWHLFKTGAYLRSALNFVYILKESGFHKPANS